MVAKKRSKLAGAAVGQMGQLGRKHDSRGGMEGSYGGSKPSAGQKLNLHTQHSSTGRSIKTGSFHPAESATATVSPRGSNTKQAAPKKQGKAVKGTGAKAKQPAVPHTLQRGKKGGSFYMSAGGKKVYTKK